jgi:predicted nucleotidyltransferase
MMPSHLRPVLLEQARLASRFAARFSEVRLFGSRGEATEDSDLDVLVLVDGLEAVAVRTVGGFRIVGAGVSTCATTPPR